MDSKFTQEQQYVLVRKRVEKIKGFYIHLSVYIIVNILLSGVIVYGLMSSGDTFSETFSNFGVYSTWVFWGIGLFFNWLGVFGFRFLGFGSDWEERKIKQLLEEEENRTRKF
ncbi:MAG: hypothetical protein ACJAVE_000861 [Polaribacter sp.]|jgi:hypothetical protein|tara:strand:- start:1098 stop:1433 length:336 start_codon:yes stop_codon:yes gene_type:complete